ncbi:discoidin domain-containing protein [Cohnella sp. LGH]|uniref:discoidin domain-containing protein n=1 Tax=Cohnella sp. LGH TaxID=1619153 RepID=UPI001AD960D6|nr:discoidin domain-containing protein [Cohnella sp. LGH]QTH45677.1 discoidin domain-containing protein [Cohnella sp. LGH]
MSSKRQMLGMLFFAAAFVAVLLLVKPGEASAAVYYVNNQSGSGCNNAGAGTSTAAPWCDFTPVNAKTFSAGDQVLLKSGAAWTGQTLNLQGEGTASQPILLSSYSTGNKPIIAPGTIDSIAVLLNGKGGWKIANLELSNAWERIRLQYDHVYNKDYIWIENLTIRNMTSAYNSAPTSYNHTSAGISVKTMADAVSPPYSDKVNAPGRLTALTNLTIKNVNFYNCDTATWFGAPVTGFNPSEHLWVKKVIMQDLTIDGGGMWGFNALFVDGGVFTNLVAKNIGGVSNPFGSAGFVIAYSKNVEVIGGEIVNVSRHPDQNYDGVGFDFEGVGKNISLRNMNIRNTAGAGIFHYNNSGLPDIDTVIDNNIVSHYGNNPGNSSEGIYFAGGSGIVTNNVFNNSFARSTYGGSYGEFVFAKNTANTVSPSFVPVPPLVIGVPAGTELVTSQVPGTLRNDSNGEVGFKFTTGATEITLQGLGRKAVAGNYKTHTLKLRKDSDKSLVGACSVSTSTAVPDSQGYQYCKLAANVSLQPATSYLLTSTEDYGGDYWHSDDTTIALGTGTVNGSIYNNGGGWSSGIAGNRAYGPVTLLYTLTNIARSGTAAASGTDTANGYAASKVNDGIASTDFNGWASASPAMPQWIEIDFGSNKTFGRVELYTTSGYELRGYQIQVWNGSSWVNAFPAVTGNSSAHRTHMFAAVTGSKIRVYSTQGDAASSYARVNELEVYSY